jgi:GT2 family glycosyltransferase
MKIVAGYVLYHPDVNRFKKGLDSVLQQFDEVIVFDNCGDMKEVISIYDNVFYYTENENRGIAYGLNQIMKAAEKMGYDWVVTLDQDSVIPLNTCSYFEKFIDINNVAIICPQVIDKRRLYINPIDSNVDFLDVDFCITSASCTNIKIWSEVGGFDNWLFIDFVDNDFCKRIKLAGYRIVQLPALVIDQEFGKITLKSPGWIRFYLWLSRITHNKNIAKLSYRKEVSPQRVYYVHRNLLYLNKKFKKYGGIGYENFYCKSFIGFLMYFTIPSIIRGKDKFYIAKAAINGLYDGYKAESIGLK